MRISACYRKLNEKKIAPFKRPAFEGARSLNILFITFTYNSVDVPYINGKKTRLLKNFE